MVAVTIIIPIYNCERYLSKCLDSAINQTLKNIEIICVDDGSTDSTPKILHEYSDKDSRIIVITQKNSKQGCARNRGLEIAKGEYVTFLDSDDWLDANYCELLYNAVKKIDVNIAVANIIRKKKNKQRHHLKLKFEKAYYGANNILKAIDWHLETAGKLYKFGCIKDLQFPEGVLYEDAPFTIRAINQCNSAVAVPNAIYYYYSNPKSSIKLKHSEKRRNDIIESQLDILNYAKKYNIILKNNLIIKDELFPFKIKIFEDRKEYYFLGLKFFTKYENFNTQKIFVVIQLACFGDAILCNSLFQNIKNIYPNSKTIFIVDKPYLEVAKYQKDVDEVYTFDKFGKNKGLFGIFKFSNKFPYKNIDYVFKLHNTARVKILSHCLKPRKLYEMPDVINVTIQERNINLLKKITDKKIINCPIKYVADKKIPSKFQGFLSQDKKYVALCTTTKQDEKDMPVQTAVELIGKLNAGGYEVLFVGNGDKADKYAQDLIKNGAKFINLVNQTSIYELAQVLRSCVGTISVDTGTMHFSYANDVPTVCVFYKECNIKYWAPDKHLYPHTIVANDLTAEGIYQDFRNQIVQKEYANAEN